MIIANFIPFTLAAWAVASLEWLNNNSNVISANPLAYWVIIALVILLNLPAAWFVAGRGLARDWYHFCLLPISVSVAVLSLLTITEQTLLQQVLIIGLTLLFYFYWRSVFFYFHNQSRYTSFALENLSFYVNFIAVFIGGAAALGMKLFLGLSLWLILPIAAVWLALVIYQVYWASKYPKDKWYFAVIMWLGLMEMFAALALLPNDHLMLGFIWATAYYLVVTVVNDYLRGGIDNFKLKAYLIITGLSWLLIFSTAVWH